MTPDQEQRLEVMEAHCAKMDRFWFQSEIPNAATRAEQLDKVLFLSKWSGFSVKAVMLFFGLVTTVAVGWVKLTGGRQ